MGTYLVTGGHGFIGRELVRQLHAAGAQVKVLDALVEQVHGPSAESPRSDAQFIKGDVRDRTTVLEALDGVDGVFHLAAEVGVGQSMYEISRYVSANDYGTAILLEALIEKPVRRLVVASSMSVYGEGLYTRADGSEVSNARRPAQMGHDNWDPRDTDGAPLTAIPTDETKPVDLASIYALTKYQQERAAMIFGSAFETETVALRLFNVFGPGQALSNPYTGVLANFGSRLANGRHPIVFEDGRQKRDFVHVRDVAHAFRLAMEKPEAAGHVFNIGSGQSYSIASVAQMLAEEMGRADLSPEITLKARTGDIRHCFANTAKAREMLGYTPVHRLELSLGELVRWISEQKAEDRGAEMRSQLEQRGLVR